MHFVSERATHLKDEKLKITKCRSLGHNEPLELTIRSKKKNFTMTVDPHFGDLYRKCGETKSSTFRIDAVYNKKPVTIPLDPPTRYLSESLINKFKGNKNGWSNIAVVQDLQDEQVDTQKNELVIPTSSGPDSNSKKQPMSATLNAITEVNNYFKECAKNNTWRNYYGKRNAWREILKQMAQCIDANGDGIDELKQAIHEEAMKYHFTGIKKFFVQSIYHQALMSLYTALNTDQVATIITLKNNIHECREMYSAMQKVTEHASEYKNDYINFPNYLLPKEIRERNRKIKVHGHNLALEFKQAYSQLSPENKETFLDLKELKKVERKRM